AAEPAVGPPRRRRGRRERFRGGAAVKVALAGGTRGIGRALARLLVERGHRVVLLGRDREQLERSAADLAARAPGAQVGWAPLDLARPEGFAGALDVADTVLGGFDALVVTAADFATQDELEADPERLRRLLD